MADEDKDKKIDSDKTSDDDSSKKKDDSKTSDKLQTDTDKKVDKEIDDQLPEKFKDKSATEIAKSYLELEKKLGDSSSSVAETRKKLEQWETLGKVIKGNPDLEKQVLAEIDKISGTSKEDATKKQPDDTRKATETIIVNNFERNFGIDRLPSEKRTDMFKKISNELVEIVDPGGNRTVREVLDEIPLERLPIYLEKAYKLATVDDAAEQNRLKGFLEARNNSEGMFGSIPSGSTKRGIELTPQQKETAKKMKISEEEYRKQLGEIEKEKEEI